MKWVNGLVVVALGLGLVGMGCKTNKKPNAETSPSVSDLNTAPAAVPAYTPPTPVEPSVTSTPTVVTPAPGGMSGSTKYTVKKGDTLWKIAATHFGDGKQYTKIISANPGLKAETLKAGQTITLP